MTNKIELTPEEVATIRKLNDAQQGMQNFMQSMMQAGETRALALQTQGREMWAALAEKYGFDLQKQSWLPSADGKSLVLVAQRFDNA